jgi:V/A-type H+/Na+-transporting ATPase subunit I
MGIRPQAARWFELLTPREELTKALECLAQTRAVELQTHSQPEHALELPGLPKALDEYGECVRRFGAWWPEGEIPPIEEALEPVSAMADALARVRAWIGDAEPLITQGEQLETEATQLAELAQALDAPGLQLPDLHMLAAAGPVLAARIYRMLPKTELRSLPTAVITQSLVSAEGIPHLLAVGPMAQLEGLDRQMAALKARRVTLPEWLPRDIESALAEITTRRDQLVAQRAEVKERLAALDAAHGMPRAIGTMALMAWFAGHAPSLPVTEHFAWVTGWTSDVDGHEINEALDRGKVRHLLRYKEAPAGVECPVVMHNPRWAKPFELFPNLLGTPGSSEADPSRIVALVAPLMFGFMFGDVGQGAVLLALGLWLRKRVPVFGLLVPYGSMAILFGFLFGSIFSNEELIPALWMHPINYPAKVMGIAIAFGVVILTTGLLLDALGAYWRRQGLFWLATRGGILAAYLGLVTAGAGYLGALSPGRRCPGPQHHVARLRVVRARHGADLAPQQAAGDSQGAGRAAREHAADRREHRLLRARRRLCTGARRAVGRRDRHGRGHRRRPRLAAGDDPRQRAGDRARGPDRRHPDHPPAAVRILHSFPYCRRPPASSAGRPRYRHPTDRKEFHMKLGMYFVMAMTAVTVCVVVTATYLFFTSGIASAQDVAEAGALVLMDPSVKTWGFASAAAAAGLSAAAAGYAVAQVGSAAVGALAEKPELMGRVLVMVGLAEGVAIYGLIVAILILNQLG